MSHTLLAVRSLADDSPHDLYPVFDEGGQLILSESEEVLGRGTASSVAALRLVGESWHTVTELNAKTELVITNKRIVYVCRKYKKGGTWFGGGFAVFMMMVEAAWAAFSRRGKAAVGQVRYDWPRNVMQQTDKLGPLATSFVALTCQDEAGLLRIKLGMSKNECGETAQVLATQIASFRNIKMPLAEQVNKARTSGAIYTLPSAREVGKEL